MISKNLDFNFDATNSRRIPSVLHVSDRDLKSRRSVGSASLAAWKATGVRSESPAKDRLPFAFSGSNNGGRARRVKSAIRLGQFVKRAMDVGLSAVGMVLFSPWMFVIAIAVRLESPGHVFYRSLRVGQFGQLFECYKFRTMVDGSDCLKQNLRRLNQRRGPFFKIADDPRLTRLGRFLRKYSLDELPQLWNVMMGDMSLVGPRPHPVEDCAQYSSEHFRRLGVKPGVTGLWQVLARANPSFETCMKCDLAYIENWSLLLDCRILVKTITAVLAGEGQ
jgi:lipopolysaccharide/colanic/teichoic acid biosynthesis glycosyltransferase